jgi:hypothetical protein
MTSAQAQSPWLPDASYQYTGALGLDAWDIDHNASSESYERVLFLANSTPQWSERNPSPWFRLDAHAQLTSDVSGRFKIRGSQSSGTRVDELNLKWDLSPSLGGSVGVVDYKTSWCRTYDVDSPWVRENDPFCTVKTTDQATGAGPGIQLHANSHFNNWSAQYHLGWFNPLLFDYNEEDAANTTLNFESKVIKNQKVGAGVSWLHHATATELRLGLLHTNLVVDWDPYGDGGPLIPLKASNQLMFIGLNVYPTPFWSVRLTYLNEDYKGTWLSGDQNWRSRTRQSASLENSLRINSNNTLAMAVAHYRIRVQDRYRSHPDDPWTAFPQDTFDNVIYSVTWRKDWSPTFFTALQASRSRSVFDFYSLGKSSPSGTAYGLRVGLRF